MEYLRKKEFLEKIRTFDSDIEFLFIAVLCKNRDNLKKYKPCNYTFINEVSHKGFYTALFHYNGPANFVLLLKMLESEKEYIKIEYSTFSKSENERRKTERIEAQELEKDLKKDFIKSFGYIEKYKNSLTENDYEFEIDEDNMIEAMRWNSCSFHYRKINNETLEKHKNNFKKVKDNI